MKPNEFLSLIEGYWKEALTSDNREIYRRAVSRFKPDDLRRISDAVVESCVFFPKVRDILAAAEGLQIEEEPKAKPPHGCPDCDGTTWVSVTVKHPQTGQPYEAVKSCGCTLRQPPTPAPPKAKQSELTPVAKFTADVYLD